MYIKNKQMENGTDGLNEAIIVLRERRTRELESLQAHLDVTYESLKPINFIKSTFREVSSSPEIKSNILGHVIGIGTGFIVKRLWVGHSHNPVKKLFGVIVQFAIASFVAKHSDDIKYLGKGLLRRYWAHKDESERAFSYNGNDLLR